MTSLNYLIDYIIRDKTYIELLDDETPYFNRLNSKVCYLSSFGKFKRMLLKPFCVKLFNVSQEELEEEFIMQIDNPKIGEYISLFPKEEKHKAIIEIIHYNCFWCGLQFGNGMDIDAPVLYYMKEKVIPQLTAWSKKHKIKVDFSHNKPENYVLDDNERMLNTLVPTDGISLKALIANYNFKNLYFDCKTYLVEQYENEAGGCVKVPYMDEEEFYDFFLDSTNQIELKEKLHNSDEEFPVAFRIYFEWPLIQSFQYLTFKNEFVKNVMVKWCNENSIKYIDDIEEYNIEDFYDGRD